jgi:hypothetical protein
MSPSRYEQLYKEEPAFVLRESMRLKILSSIKSRSLRDIYDAKAETAAGRGVSKDFSYP